MLIENLSINITPNGVPLVIHISQYDVGLRTFIFTPYTSSGTFTPDTAVSATLEGTKPDGNIIIHNCEYDSATGQITYTIQEQLAAVAGRVWSKIVLRDTDGNAIGYTAIVWLVDMAGVADGAVASDSDISALAEFIKEFGTINAYKSALDGAIAAVGGPNVASTVAQMTDRTKVYVYTGSQSGYTAGHWYYWNGSAWTDGGVYQATAVETDKTLAVTDMAADAKATGDAVTELKNEINDILDGISDDVTPTFISGKVYFAYNGKVFNNDSASYFNGVIDAEEGYYYIVKTGVPSNLSYYGVIFADDSDNVLAQYGQSTTGSPVESIFGVTAPVGTTKMYINNRVSSTTPAVYQCINDDSIDDRINYLINNSDLVQYLEYENESVNILQDAVGVYNGFIGGTGKINTTTYDIWNLYKYPVTANKSYRLYGEDVNIEYDAYSIATFSESDFDGTTSINKSSIIIPSGHGATDTNYDTTYTPATNGYIYISQYGTRNKCDLYEIVNEKYSKLINKLTGTNFDTIKIQIFGDSMSDDIWRKTWNNFIADFIPQREWDIVNCAVGGSGIGHGKSVLSGGRYQDLEYNFVYDLITNPDVFETDNDIVVMFVGTNNFAYPAIGALGQWGDNTSATVFGAARLICQYVSEHTDALFVVCTPLPRYNQQDSERNVNADGVPINQDGKTLRDYCDALVQTCHFFHIPVIDLNYEIGWNRYNISNFANDGLHPNQKGAEIVGAYISSVLKQHLGI